MADNFTPVQAPRTTLTGGGVTSSATSISIKTIKKPDDTAYTMSDFGSIGYATIEPSTSRVENISFTGITNNGDGTMTLTGVTRGLDLVDPYTTDAGLQFAHGGGVTLVFSNSAPFYGKIPFKDNEETITQEWTFSQLPQSDGDTPTNNNHFATKAYVDSLVSGGSVINESLVVPGTAGATIAAGNLVYYDTTDKEWKLCDADTAASVENVILGIAQGSGTDGNAIGTGVLLWGIDDNQSGMTAGNIMYASNTAGAIGSSAGTKEVTIGIANSATQLYFAPRFNQQITEDIQDALAGTSGTPSGSNKYVTDDDTTGTGDVLRASAALTGFGSWASAVVGTPTQAATDGFLVGYVDWLPAGFVNGDQGTVSIKTDASDPPTTVRALFGAERLNVSPNPLDGQTQSFCVPVKGGDYYLITETDGDESDVTAYWIPFS